MVKLVRLTSDDDGKFNANLDSDLVVGEDAQVAVQNLTFQTEFTTLDVSASQTEIQFNLDRTTYAPATSRTTGDLEPAVYTSTNYPDFFPAMQTALNDTMLLNAGFEDPPPGQGKYQSGGQFFVGSIDDANHDLNDKKNIFFRLSPVIHPQVIGVSGRLFNPQDPQSAAAGARYPKYEGADDLFSINEDVDEVETLDLMGGQNGAQDVLTYGGYKKKNLVPSSSALDSFLYPSSEKVNWCKGSAIYYARIASLPVGGIKGEEGFAIGLSKTPIRGFVSGAALPETSRDYEIRCFRRNDNYQFITPDSANVPADSNPPFSPHSADVTGGGDPSGIAANDIMMIEKTGTKIIGSVVNGGGGGYLNLPAGNNWTQTPAGAIEKFDEVNLGAIATYRRTQVTPASGLVHWWEAVNATDWNLYTTGPPVFGQAVNATATADLATGVITINPPGPGAIQFNPQGGLNPGVVPTGTKKTFFTYDIPIADRGLDLYPYMYICGAEGTAAGAGGLFNGSVVGWVGMTVDPFSIQELENFEDEQDDPYLDLLRPFDGNVWGAASPPGVPILGAQPALSFSTPDIVALLPQLDEELYYARIFGFPETSTILTIDKEILRFMGFSRPEFRGAGAHSFEPTYTGFEYGFELIPTADFQVQASDNYLVILDSHPVISYDCSLTQGSLLTDKTAAKTGRRMNIIATIPDNNNQSGVVEFDANELIFIDLDNNYKQNISNIRARILTKDLQEIQTTGTSILTLLIKDTKKE